MQKMQTIRFPSISFSEAHLEEAIEYLRTKSRDLDPEQGAENKGINIIYNAADTPGTARITLDLKDVPFEEALRYVTELAGMKYLNDGGRIIVVPVTESTSEQVTRAFTVPAGFCGSMSAKDWLSARGVPFPDGASAVYSVPTTQLIVKNTHPNLDLVETVFESLRASPTKSGLLTLALDLPTTGQRLHFHGLQAPTSLDLNYRSWERQFTIALLLMGVGAGLFVALGRRRPVMLTLLAILVLGLGVSLLVEEWQPLGNALLIGWLAAAALALISRSVQIISTRITERRLA